MAEIRILLDMGSVREGERIVHAGVPWRITSPNVYSTLHNPLLRGGTFASTALTDWSICNRALMRRRNPGFPSRENDIVILDGDIYGKVLVQTPRWCSYRSSERVKILRSPIISARTRAICRWKVCGTRRLRAGLPSSRRNPE